MHSHGIRYATFFIRTKYYIVHYCSILPYVIHTDERAHARPRPHARMPARAHVCPRTATHAHTHGTHAHTHGTHARTHTYTRQCVCVCVFFKYIHIYMNIYIYKYIYIRVCVCVYLESERESHCPCI